MRDVWTVGRFEVFRAIRSWQAMAIVSLFLIANVGGAWMFIEVLREIENGVAAQLGVPETAYPGAMMEQVRESPSLLQLLTFLVGEEDRAKLLVEAPVLAVFQLWLGLALIPLLAAFSAAECVSADMSTRALRFEALRTGRGELVAGRMLGQALLCAAATAIALAAVWGVGLAFMAKQSPVELGWALVQFGSRAVLCALPWVGVAVGVSQIGVSPAWSRVAALTLWSASWIAYGIFQVVDDAPWTYLADLFLPVLPHTWTPGYWGSTAEVLTAGAVHAVMGVAFAATGFAWFSRRDL
jgi:ABC-type transport system involved in multi-copper enzyme maturation permease subunit